MLPDFVLPSRAGQQLEQTGIDSVEFCQDPEWFQQYPHAVSYVYNSRGFRDQEWPQDLSQAVWCFGDSFTVGVGSAHSKTWPQILQTRLARRCINVSMDGASNQWIRRKVQSLAGTLRPRQVIIQWSYIHRREATAPALTEIANRHWREFYSVVKDPAWPVCDTLAEFHSLPGWIQQEIQQQHAGPRERMMLNTPVTTWVTDEDRRLYLDPHSDVTADAADTMACIQSVHDLDLPVIHSFVPGFAPLSVVGQIVDYLNHKNIKYQAPFLPLDHARDGHHYGVATAEWFVDQIVPLI